MRAREFFVSIIAAALVACGGTTSACPTGGAVATRTTPPKQIGPALRATEAAALLTSTDLIVDPSQLVWDVEIVSPEGQSETIPLSEQPTALPVALPCGVGPIQRETKTEYYALRALNCVHQGMTFSSVALCEVNDRRLHSSQAFMTVRDVSKREIVLSLMCRAR